MVATGQSGRLLPPILHDAYPRHAAKLIARDAGATYETARNWLRGRACPSFEMLARMAQRNDALRASLTKALTAHAEPMAPVAPAAAGMGGAAAHGLVAAPGRVGTAAEVTR